MSGVRAAKSISSELNQIEPGSADAEIAAMQDVLYDILANGMDADRADVSTAEVERFLFEHARAPKSRAEFAAFFVMHKLSAGSRSLAPMPALVLPPIERVERGMPARLPVELSVLAEESPDETLLPVVGFEPRPRKPSRVLLWAALAGVTAAALSVLGFYGYRTITELQRELDRTAEHGRKNREALQSLRDHAAGLESSVAATGELVQRMDQKSDLLLETLQGDAKAKPARKRYGSVNK